jgi:hypothetical protein
MFTDVSEMLVVFIIRAIVLMMEAASTFEPSDYTASPSVV